MCRKASERGPVSYTHLDVYKRQAPGEHIVPRIVRVGPDDPSFPIGRLTILYDGKPVKYGTYFDAPDDWLRHVSVSFQNRSAKTLIAGFLQID